tara:strand:- start:5031 stop:5879 length:849 start_codon:yes stop_codon:yes gene_type:complete
MKVTYDPALFSAKKQLVETKIQSLEQEFLRHPQVDCPVVHRFGPGLYIREVTLPAGALSIGHAQKTEHLNVMLTGRVSIVGENGKVKELVAPLTFVGQPGRKVGYIHETVIWQNIYATTETDVAKLESMFLDKSDTWKESQPLLSFNKFEDNADFVLAIAEYGFDEKTVREQSENTFDQINFPFGGYGVMVSDSSIEGKGLFATKDFLTGEIIAPARILGLRTPAGRYTNHSKNPNATMFLKDNGDIDLIANSKIKGYQGGTIGQEVTVDYRQALNLTVGRI